MNAPACEILVTTAPLEPPAPHFSAVSGAVLDFYGVVRGKEETEPISGIDYEAHEEMARHQLELLCREACEQFPLHGLVLHHRIGYIPTAIPSLFLRVSTGHRGSAFEAAQWLIEQLKLRIPIWKHPLSQSSGEEVHHPAAAAHVIQPEASPDAVA